MIDTRLQYIRTAWSVKLQNYQFACTWALQIETRENMLRFIVLKCVVPVLDFTKLCVPMKNRAIQFHLQFFA